MSFKAIFILYLIVNVTLTANGQAIINLANHEAALERIVKWEDKGLIVIGRNKSETILNFVNSSGSLVWTHSIPHEKSQDFRTTVKLACNKNYFYYILYNNTKTGTRAVVHMAGEDGKFSQREKEFEKYKILTTELLGEGVVLVMKDNAKKEEDRTTRLVTFKEESREISESIDIELPEGRWSLMGAFRNQLALHGSRGFINETERRDTFCFLNASGALRNNVILELKMPKETAVGRAPRFIFDEDAALIHSYILTRDEGENYYPFGFRVLKYDLTGRIVQDANKKFADLAAMNPEFEKKGLYHDFLDCFLLTNEEWGGPTFFFEKSEKPKKTVAIHMAPGGTVKQAIVGEHNYINEKYFNTSGGYLTVLPSAEVRLDLYTTLFSTQVDPTHTSSADAFSKVAKLAGSEEGQKAYYNVVRVGGKDLVLEYLPRLGLLKIYN
jgi:hypothetical protein